MKKIFKRDIKSINTPQELLEYVEIVNYKMKCFDGTKEGMYGRIDLDNYGKKSMLRHIQALLSDKRENSIQIFINVPRNGTSDGYTSYLHESYLLKAKHGVVEDAQNLEAL